MTAVLCPDWARTPEVLAAVLNVAETACDAWEQLATQELIPMAWLSDAQRRFNVPDVSDAGELCSCVDPEAPLTAALPHPPTRWACAAIAADVAGVVQCEALAREFAGRLAPWGKRIGSTVNWREIDRAKKYLGGFNYHPVVIADVVMQLRHHDISCLPAPGAADGDSWEIARETSVLLARGWRTLATRGIKVRPTSPNRRLPQTVLGKRFRELANPFEPLLDIWDRGYVLLAAHEGGIVLGYVAPQPQGDTIVVP